MPGVEWHGGGPGDACGMNQASVMRRRYIGHVVEMCGMCGSRRSVQMGRETEQVSSGSLYSGFKAEGKTYI